MKRHKNVRGPDVELVLWLVEHRTDIGLLLDLARLVFGAIEDHVIPQALRALSRAGRIVLRKDGRRLSCRPPSIQPDGDLPAAKARRQSQDWPGTWFLLTYDLHSGARHMRRELIHAMHALGLGMANRSTWVSPYDWWDQLRPHADELGATRYVVGARSASLLLAQRPATFAARVWPLAELNQAYQDIVGRCRAVTASRLRSAAERRVAIRQAFRASKAWQNVRREDPMLPAELLSALWYASEAEREIEAMRRRIRSQFVGHRSME